MSSHKKTTHLTSLHIRQRKEKEPVVVLTAYDGLMASLLDAHCDVLLVGDSLGMVRYGMDSTLSVTTEMMIMHGRAVVQASSHACVVVDMPFGSYQASPEQAFENAAQIMADTGCDAVKLEGGETMAKTIQFLTQRGIPVMAHIGLTPQYMHQLGGFRVQGRNDELAAMLIKDAKAIDEAGAFAVVVEGVVEPVAVEITKAISIPTIGIGASVKCDGQVLVTEDLLGLTNRPPKFVKVYAKLDKAISEAVEAYASEVKSRQFPGAEQLYK
jgi:3-methyl-2-oxobutanoate hydroxymethyltransferase